MLKKEVNKSKAVTTTVKGTITLQQKEMIRSLVGVLGSNEQDVVGKILVLWLYSEGFLKTRGIANSNKKEANG